MCWGEILDLKIFAHPGLYGLPSWSSTPIEDSLQMNQVSIKKKKKDERTRSFYIHLLNVIVRNY